MALDPSLLRNIVRRRWLRCAILCSAISSFLWLVCVSCLSRFARWYLHSSGLMLSWRAVGGGVAFLVAQVIFLLGEMVVTAAEDENSVAVGDIAFGVVKLAWSGIVGSRINVSPSNDVAVLARKLQTTANRFLFTIACATAGFLSMACLRWASLEEKGPFVKAFHGAVLGLVYAIVHIYRKKMILSFPIIQRGIFFGFKMGFQEAAWNSLKLSAMPTIFVEMVVLVVNSRAITVVWSQKALLAHVTTALFCDTFIAFCWELCHHLCQVVHTSRHRFSPSFGTSAAETTPHDLLLMALEKTEKNSVIHYLAVLDLCTVSESNVDAWRRGALFEESGETYQRVITECLRPLDMLTMQLASYVNGSYIDGDKDILKHQMQSHGYSWKSKGGSIDQIFKDLQLCSWCARSAAALTSCSKNEDMYGVAQLRGCNSAVVSSLLSCLLVTEVSLGRRRNTQYLNLIGPNNIRWTVPSRGMFEDIGIRHHLPFKKKTALHKKAYAMADIICISLYQIVNVFKDEIASSISTSKSSSLAERDWLGNSKPLYESHETHLQMLSLFLEFKVN
eukprot:c20284_g1_i1 orf=597-2279(-)